MIGSVFFVFFAFLPVASALSLTVSDNEDDSMPWYEAVTSYHFPHLYSTDLEAGTFAQKLSSSTATYVMIDFYAPWCPHCQHFAPEFERLALAVQRSAEENQSVLVANVDCVRSADICRQWGIDSYPSLLWGKRSDWLANATNETEKAEFSPRAAEGAAKWISNRTRAHLDVSHVSKDEVFQLLRQGQGQQANALAASISNGVHSAAQSMTADPWDAQLAVGLLLHGAFATQTFPMTNLTSGKQRVLLDMIALLAERFPKDAKGKCRSSLRDLHHKLTQNFRNFGEVIEPEDAGGLPMFWVDPDKLESEWKLCGMEWKKYSQGFHACRGSWPGKRGYTCGLWTTFHMVAANSNDREAARDMDIMRDTIKNFFDCDECRDHFLRIPVTANDKATKKDAQLWWWTSHNFVNHRVGALEVQYQDGDPAYVKQQWPTASMCPSCQRSDSLRGAIAKRAAKAHAMSLLSAPQENLVEDRWDRNEVSVFLQRFYGAA